MNDLDNLDWGTGPWLVSVVAKRVLMLGQVLEYMHEVRLARDYRDLLYDHGTLPYGAGRSEAWVAAVSAVAAC